MPSAARAHGYVHRAVSLSCVSRCFQRGCVSLYQYDAYVNVNYFSVIVIHFLVRVLRFGGLESHSQSPLFTTPAKAGS